MGKGIVDKLKEDYDIQDQWVGLEIHPETPYEGVVLSDRFGHANLEGMKQQLQKAGAPYGIKFAQLEHMPNSNMALQAAEFARGQGQFDAYHGKLLQSYFSEGKNIGDLDVLKGMAKEVNLDPDALEAVLKNNQYASTLKDVTKTAATLGISSTPTFIINNTQAIVGAQNIDTFRRVLDEVKNREE